VVGVGYRGKAATMQAARCLIFAPDVGVLAYSSLEFERVYLWLGLQRKVNSLHACPTGLETKVGPGCRRRLALRDDVLIGRLKEIFVCPAAGRQTS